MNTKTLPIKIRPTWGQFPSLLIHFYAITLKLYPSAFRAAFAEEMLDVFTMTVRESRGNWALLGVISRELGDLPFSLWQARHRAYHQLPASVQRVQQARLTVRIVASLLALFLLSTLTTLLSPAYNLHAPAVPFVATLFIAVVSMLIGILWGRVGGILTILSGAGIGFCMTLYIYVMAVDKLGIILTVLIGLLWALPFLIFGLLFYHLSQPSKQLIPA